MTLKKSLSTNYKQRERTPMWQNQISFFAGKKNDQRKTQISFDKVS
jgi:hypothetical protein